MRTDLLGLSIFGLSVSLAIPVIKLFSFSLLTHFCPKMLAAGSTKTWYTTTFVPDYTET
jgi:hypothetical protein